MNVLLQKHGAKHIYKVPEGLRELCTDIAREVLRSQPRNIYCFVADYVEALLITRENAKVAVKVVNNILLGSQAIVDILHRSGLNLEQIVRAAPRIQTAFRAYLDAVDMRATQVRDDTTCDERSKVSLQSILQATEVPLEQAEKHATIIQAAFREHYERMLLNESRGMIQWQRAATRTLEILRKAGASQAEASKAAILIQATYRGYYTRRNLKMKTQTMQSQEEEKKSEVDMIEPKEDVQAVAWLDMMYEKSGLTSIRANEAASTIQKAYRRYRERKNNSKSPVESTTSTVTEAILKNLHQKVFDEVLTRADIPAEFGNREDLTKAGEELQRAFKDRLTLARLTQEYDEEKFAYEEESDESFEKVVDSISVPEDWQEDREIEIESERDEETNAYV
ncbi:PREDICTED: uncharacterized protein LOC108758743 [Trachymyrmex cornetzi]|uniref:RIIa domain-containing protein n=1 Tax=Trachymyrmex cornetzi TaxID=471704 RepID=A0A195ECL9_9HYME|nr:PREDICTED: uncharacterized protein LOC108758743 [Trachymyrmex cornetzi]KYN22958.1 hypothetical protein ALC57_04741 [Trachymyrmex cornetzi]